MKNDTKIKVRLSKQLFESLTKQIIAEGKVKHNLGAGMKEVKAQKGKKKERVEETVEMVDENMLADLMGKLKTLPADKLKQLKTYWDNKLSPEAVRTGRIKGVTLPSNIEEMETNVAEDSTGLEEDEANLVNPASWPTHLKDVTGYIGAVFGSGIIGAVFYGIMNDLKKGKISKKQAAMKLADEFEKAAAKATDEPAPKG